MYCSQCGKEIGNEKFCSNCGHQCIPDEKTDQNTYQNDYTPSMEQRQAPKRTSKTVIIVLIAIVAALAIIPIIIVIIVGVYVTRHSEEYHEWKDQVYEHDLMQNEESYEYPQDDLDKLLENILK